MNREFFVKECSEWSHTSWNKGNLFEYWEKGGLDLKKIIENKKKLETKNTICVLGSVGKTTLSRILFDIMNIEGQFCYVTRVNDNWLPQLPFAAELALRKKSDFVIFECGVASKGDVCLMSMIIPAKSIVYTQFERVHLSQLTNLEGVANEKISFALEHPNAKIVSHSKNKIYLKKKGFKEVLYYGDYGSNTFYEYQVKNIFEDGTDVEVRSKGRKISFKINEIGFHLGPACAGALASYESLIGKTDKKYFEINRGNIKERMNKYSIKGTMFLVDTANANDRSILNSLKSLIAMNTTKKKNAVIGEIYGLGKETKDIIKESVEEMCVLDLNVLSSLHFIGENYIDNKDILKRNYNGKIAFYNKDKEFISSFNIADYQDQIILLRGPTKKGVNFSNMLNDYNGISDETSPEEVIK